jgi:biopolymer transport protein ExbD
LLEDARPQITPLIDCILLLLVFFMVTTAFFSLKAIEVTMPGVAPGAPATEDLDINVYITGSGAIQVQGIQVALDQLEDAFTDAMRVQGKKALVLEAAAGVRHERVVQVMDCARSAGIHEIAFAHTGESDHGP